MSIDSVSRKQVRKDLQTGKWADDHGLFHELLPYGYRKKTPLEILRALRDAYQSLGRFKQLWQASHVRDETDERISPRQHRELILWSGAWPVYTHREGNPHSYANPLYTHEKYPPIEHERRKEIISNTWEMPHWDCVRLGWAFGISQDSAEQYRKYHFGKMGRQRVGIEKLARTVKTINSWGYSYRDVGDALPYKWKTLHKQVQDYAQDFKPPSNPLNPHGDCHSR